MKDVCVCVGGGGGGDGGRDGGEFNRGAYNQIIVSVYSKRVGL